jgi:hypothetical protein
MAEFTPPPMIPMRSGCVIEVGPFFAESQNRCSFREKDLEQHRALGPVLQQSHSDDSKQELRDFLG